MAFKFYIDGFLTDQPNNDTELITNIKRDSELGGFLTTQDVTLIYAANNNLDAGTISGYSYLESLFISGTCNAAEIVIYDEISVTETYRVYTGVIKVPAIEIEQHKKFISVKIDDNSFYSFIKNNRNVEFNLYATKTKNGLAIAPPQIYEVDCFFSATGTYGSSVGIHWRGYRVYDVFKFLIPAITDNKVTFESTYLTSMAGAVATPSDPIELFIFDGYALGHKDTNPNVIVSFEKLIKEINKIKNLSFYIDQADPDNPVFRLEAPDFFFVQSDVVTFDEPMILTESIKSEKIYATVKTGSEYNPGGADALYTWNAGTSYFGWKEEKYTMLGQCNTEAELDLLNNYIISSNAINDQLFGATSSNMDSVFLMECHQLDTALFTAKAVKYDVYGNGAVRYYNVGLNNVNKIANHGGSFQTALTNTQNAGSDICHISLGQDTILADFNTGTQPYATNPISFADEFGGNNYDGGNNWSLIDFDYTAPLPGDYSFTVNLNVDVTNCAAGVGRVQNLAVYSGGFITVVMYWGVEITTYIAAYTDNTYATLIGSVQNVQYAYVDGNGTINVNMPINLPTNAHVKAIVSVTTKLFAPGPTGTNSSGQIIPLPYFGNAPIPNTWTIQIITNPYNGSQINRIVYALLDSYFECNGTPDGALILAAPDPNAFKVKLLTFGYDLSNTDLRDIQALPIGRFEVIKDGVSKFAFIDEFQYNNWTGRCQIKLITNDATT